MLVVGMVGIPGVEEVKLRVAELILSDTGFKLWPISSYETGSLVHNIWRIWLKKYCRFKPKKAAINNLLIFVGIYSVGTCSLKIYLTLVESNIFKLFVIIKR